ncbi:cation diffusion facilitator family transporter [Motilibacter rhizosphaerae]|uniref:Cation diffusion facilitator family transporter n=1 Tax=Motilibacter rhizosphaerae TaxID=598652 RepID=A0A4Q7NR26_9ACTN|nr:cation diffusion facilitator family transporter [Motilibacter rhizosphaerae]RZS89481.1 cation diffusion facilitator family transporter [Motilibacter rhizosphaerae]
METSQPPAQQSPPAPAEPSGGGESTATVLTALAANLAIAVAKLVGGLVSGSSAMFAEAAHSVADTMNEVFLLRSLRASRRPADAHHPFGYGKTRFFWSLLAALGIFVAGSLFSIVDGIRSILGGEGESGGYLVAYVVLAVSVLAEGTSLVKAVRQVRGEAQAHGRTFRRELQLSSDPTVKTVVAEDSAAVLGLGLAATGLALHQLTGHSWWDGLAAVLIGLVLAVVAAVLGWENANLLIGETARAELVVGCYDAIAEVPGIERVIELLTMHLGPDEVLLAARVDLEDSLPAGRIEDLSTAVETQLRERWPEVTQVFLDPTRGQGETAARTRAYIDQLRAEV